MSHFEKPLKQLDTAMGQKALGMELQTEEWIFFVGNAHDFPVSVRFFAPGGDFKFVG